MMFAYFWIGMYITSITSGLLLLWAIEAQFCIRLNWASNGMVFLEPTFS